MPHRPYLRAVGGGGSGPDPPSVLFQQLSADYPDLPRRVVGEVLSRVYGASWESAPEPLRLPEIDTAARALLDGIRLRAADAARRTGRTTAVDVARTLPHDHDLDRSETSSALDLRDALDPLHDLPVLTRTERLSEAIEARASALGVATGMSLLCAAAAEHLQVAAVAVSVPAGELSAQTIGVAGVLARPLEELQVILGEGPSQDGLRSGHAVLVEDLTTPQQQTRWPLYAPMATDHGVHAQFVFPMQVGAARFGVLVLYAERAGRLWSTESGDARVFAEVALTWLIHDVATGSPAELTEPRARQQFLDDRTEIHQATGMVSVQLGVNLSTALLRLRARAFAEDQLLSEISAAVVARTIRFEPNNDDRNGHQQETA